MNTESESLREFLQTLAFDRWPPVAGIPTIALYPIILNFHSTTSVEFKGDGWAIRIANCRHEVHRVGFMLSECPIFSFWGDEQRMLSDVTVLMMTAGDA